MTAASAVLVAGLVFGYALVSRSLARRSVSGPMVFTLAGILLATLPWGFSSGSFSEGGIEVLAEATLVVILFADATRIDFSALRKQAAIPSRMLLLGLPLTVALGAAVGVLLFDGISWIHAAILAAILAPTDAALGQAIVADSRVPARIRQALNVESGLNDGLVLPLIAILVGVAASEQSGARDTAVFVLKQVGFGVTFGILVGAVGGWLLERFVERGRVEGALRQIGVLAIAVAAFASAEAVAGNGFVAAFIAGIAFGVVTTEASNTATDFSVDQGELLVLLTFLFWGVLMVGPNLTLLTWPIAMYVVLSLTVVRMIPVALSLIGLKLERPTLGVLGWFGPRGLASILFGLFAIEHLGGRISEVIEVTVTWTCLVSIMIHGITSVPFARMYGEWFGSMTDDEMEGMAEAVEVPLMRLRVPVTPESPEQLGG